MKLAPIFLVAFAALSTARAQVPESTILIGLRSESVLDRHLPAPTVLKRSAEVHIVDQTAFISLPGQQPEAIYTSQCELTGALTSPDGRLVALIERSDSTGDRPVLLHRIEQERGARYIMESAAPAARALVEHIFENDPRLEVRPDRLRLTVVKVHPANDFQFILSGDNDLRDRSFTLIITEEAKPILFEGTGH